jgi:hypothetical protein
MGQGALPAGLAALIPSYPGAQLVGWRKDARQGIVWEITWKTPDDASAVQSFYASRLSTSPFRLVSGFQTGVIQQEGVASFTRQDRPGATGELDVLGLVTPLRGAVIQLSWQEA